MKMILSSERATLATHLFQQIENCQALHPERKQVIFVPDGGLAGWLALQRAGFVRSEPLGEIVILDGYETSEDDCVSFFHLFGFRELTSSLVALLPRDRYFWYFFSPCAHFWSDLLSEREIGKKVSKVKPNAREGVQAALDSFYGEANSLLSNGALLGREAALLLDDVSCDMKAEYRIAGSLIEKEEYRERMYDATLFSSNGDKASLLHHLQADLILLIGARSTKRELPFDKSFVLIEAVTVRSEVSALAEVLAECSKERPLDIGDVLVLSMNPSLYEGVLIESLRGKHLIIQALYEENPPLLLKMKRWLSFLESRFAVKDCIPLLSMEGIHRLLECDEEDLLELKEKMVSLPLRWGLDEAFKKKYILFHGIEVEEENLRDGTLKEAYDALFHSLFDKNPVMADSHSLWMVSMRFFCFLRDIATLWDAPLFESTEKMAQEWHETMKKMIFLLEKTFSGDETMLLLEALSSFHGEESLSFQNFSALFLEKIRFLANRKKRNITGHILLGSLLDTTPFSARIVVLLGMDDEGFMKVIRERAKEGKENRLALVNRMNYAVLDSLMQAKERFWVSHLSWDFELRQKKEPAQIVVLLSEYVENHFLLRDATFKKQKGCLEWVSLPKPARERSTSAQAVSQDAVHRMPVPLFLNALSDPLFHFMKKHYGQKGAYRLASPPTLFATTRDLLKMVEKELLSSPRSFTKREIKGVPQKVIRKELQELKEQCSLHLKRHLGEKKLVSQSLPLKNGKLFSCLHLEGELSLFSPIADICLVEDQKKALSYLWPRLCLLSLLQEELCSLQIEPSILFLYQGVKKTLPQRQTVQELEQFWIQIQEQPFPFQSDSLPTLVGKNASYYAFESFLEEKREEKNRLFSSFSLLCEEKKRRELYPLWQEMAKKLIAPWYGWLQGEES